MRGDDNSPIQVVLPTPDSSDASTITQSDAPVDANQEDDLRIYVSGAVQNPGVYRLEQDNRLSASDHSLDIVVLTHLDADHSRGLLEVLDRYQVASVLMGLENPDAALYPQWQASLER